MRRTRSRRSDTPGRPRRTAQRCVVARSQRINRGEGSGSECRNRVIYGPHRNNLLPPSGGGRYIGLDTEQDSSFEFALTGLPLSGIAPKRCIPFILTTPSESPDKKFCLHPDWFGGFDLGDAAIPHLPGFMLTGSRYWSWDMSFCPGSVLLKGVAHRVGSFRRQWRGQSRPVDVDHATRPRVDVKEKQS